MISTKQNLNKTTADSEKKHIDWMLVTKILPEKYSAVDITLRSGNDRFMNVGYRDQFGIWKVLIDPHHFGDCEVIAWRERPDMFKGKV